MIIKGELGEYEVRYEIHGNDDAMVYIYKGSMRRKIFFGLAEIENKPVYTTYGTSALCQHKRYHVERMLPNKMREWFGDAVREYERFHKAWNQ